MDGIAGDYEIPQRNGIDWKFDLKFVTKLDFMLGDSELISLRSREVTDRPLLSEADGVTSKVRLTWKIINMLFPSALIIALGIFIMRYSRKRSEKMKALYNE